MDVRLVTNQDLFFLSSALDLARLASSLPRPSDAETDKTDRSQACVLGSVVCSVSFLECSINGLYDYAQRPARTTKLLRALASVWSDAVDRQPILAKYQIALALAKREPFDTGTEPYQSAQALIELRNAIAHPKELTESERQQKNLEKKLHGKYTFNSRRPLYKGFFPDRCLSADCAFWAVQSTARLVLEFKRKMPPTAYWLSFNSSSWVQHWLTEVQRLRLASANLASRTAD
jgi:hypothetical protein